MRGLTVITLFLGLPGCSMSNPAFALTTDSDPAETGSTSTAAPKEPGTTAEPTTDATRTTTASSEAETSAGASTIEPDTTQTSDPIETGTSTDTGEPPICPLVNDAFEPYVFEDGVKFDKCEGNGLFLEGLLNIGSDLEFTVDGACGAFDPGFTITLGSGYPLLPQQDIGECVTMLIGWNNEDSDCKIGSLTLFSAATQEPIVLGVFSVPTPDLYPLQPNPANSSHCGCPGGNKTCCGEGLNPGELTLQPTNQDAPLDQFTSALITVENQIFEFYNLESWIGPECEADPNAGRRIDWIAVAVP